MFFLLQDLCVYVTWRRWTAHVQFTSVLQQQTEHVQSKAVPCLRPRLIDPSWSQWTLIRWTIYISLAPWVIRITTFSDRLAFSSRLAMPVAVYGFWHFYLLFWLWSFVFPVYSLTCMSISQFFLFSPCLPRLAMIVSVCYFQVYAQFCG